jgi:hypothetical protein
MRMASQFVEPGTYGVCKLMVMPPHSRFSSVRFNVLYLGEVQFSTRRRGDRRTRGDARAKALTALIRAGFGRAVEKLMEFCKLG